MSEARAEAPADKRTDDLHAFRWQSKDCGNLGLLVDYELSLAPQGQPISIPRCHCGMRFHGVMVFPGDLVCLVYLNGGCGKRSLGIPPSQFSWKCLWRYRLHRGVSQVYIWLSCFVRNFQRGGGALSVSHHDGYWLSEEPYSIVLQYVQPLARGRIDVALVWSV